MIDSAFVLGLIAEGESEKLDFKQSFHENNAELVHDILCIANSYVESNRFIFFGVSDSGTILGVENDQRRKTQAQIIDLLRNARLNHLPTISITELTIEGHFIDVLMVKNLPEKPYFCLREYRDGQRTVRAGTIYTRNGDTNTPIDQCADDIKLELMFRERFGLNKSPKDRLQIYLRDTASWKYGHNAEGLMYFYYEQFPEFTLTQKSDHERDFQEPWVMEFPDPTASTGPYYFMYHTTILSEAHFAWCDGGRYVTAFPEIATLESKGISYRAFYFIEDSLKDLANNMIHAVYPIQSRHYIDDTFGLFRDKDSAMEELTTDLNNGAQRYEFFYFNEQDRNHYKLAKGQQHQLFSRIVNR